MGHLDHIGSIFKLSSDFLNFNFEIASRKINDLIWKILTNISNFSINSLSMLKKDKENSLLARVISLAEGRGRNVSVVYKYFSKSCPINDFLHSLFVSQIDDSNHTIQTDSIKVNFRLFLILPIASLQ